jgi:LPS O-antigen subunit length determinant protein (WzzB/FepE family)
MNNNLQNYQPNCVEEDEIYLKELFATIWKHKIFIAVFVFIVTSLAIVYVLNKPNVYKVQTILSPQEQSKTPSLGGLASFASMAGVNIGGSSGITPDVAFKSLLDDYAFMKKFITKNKIDKKLLDPNLQKDYIFAMNNDSVYKFFHLEEKDNNKKINFYSDIYLPVKNEISITTDKKTGLITVSVMDASRKFAYDLLNKFLEDATNELINRNLKNTNAKIAKYETELKKTDNIELKAELAKLISNLIKQKVYINSSKYYKVTVVTDPYIPDVKDKAKPKRALIVIVAFITSFILGIFLVFFIEFIRDKKEEK